jgi:hypothetical protein
MTLLLVRIQDREWLSLLDVFELEQEGGLVSSQSSWVPLSYCVLISDEQQEEEAKAPPLEVISQQVRLSPVVQVVERGISLAVKANVHSLLRIHLPPPPFPLLLVGEEPPPDE